MSLENLKSATREKIYLHLREIFDEMDIVEALDSLEHRLYALRERAARHLKNEPLKEEAKTESKTVKACQRNSWGFHFTKFTGVTVRGL